MGYKHFNGNEWNARATSDTAWTNSSLRVAPGTGTALYVTDICVNCGGTARVFQLLDGSGGTVLYQVALLANTSAVVSFNVPIKLTTATALCLTSAGNSVGAFVSVGGFTAVSSNA